MSLVNLSRAYEDAQSRATRAEQQYDELLDLVCAAIVHKDVASTEWLVQIADGHQAHFHYEPPAMRRVSNG